MLAYSAIRYQIAVMSGQYDNDQVSRAFDLIMKVLDKYFEMTAEVELNASQAFVSYYEEMGSLDWHKYYDMDLSELSTMWFKDQGRTAGCPITDIPSDLDDLIRVMEFLLDLINEIIPADFRKLRKEAQRKIIPWFMYPRIMHTALVAIVRYEAEIFEIINRAKEGDENALLDLVKLDITFLTTDYARSILRRVWLTSNKSFRAELASRLRWDAKFWKIDDRRNFFALHALSWLGFEWRPYTEWCDFLEHHGFMNYTDERTVAKAAERYKVPKVHPLKTS